MVTLEVVAAARRLLASASGEATSIEVAARAAGASEQLVRHLSRLLGEIGIRTLLDRSVRLASASFPWLASATTSTITSKGSDAPAAALRTCLESQAPDVATEAFVLVLSTLVGLLVKLIGAGLVTRVLHELWPAIVSDDVKETT
jgi:hypothetical protein